MNSGKSVVINGVTVAAPPGAVAYKYADPIEDACWVFDAQAARRVEIEDSNLIVWVDPAFAD